MQDPNLWSFVANAGIVVKIVMILLLSASVISWMFIFQRSSFMRQLRRTMVNFEDRFWSGDELMTIFDEFNQDKENLLGVESIFYAGFNEFLRLKQREGMSSQAILDGTQRAMRIANSREQDKLEQHLSFLATVGSTAPYVGLFGTVWGIMTSFQALGAVQQATIAMVAPGISEALIATAMGLFAAIPAVIAYNRYASEVERVSNQYETFQEELSSILHREL